MPRGAAGAAQWGYTYTLTASSLSATKCVWERVWKRVHMAARGAACAHCCATCAANRCYTYTHAHIFIHRYMCMTVCRLLQQPAETGGHAVCGQHTPAAVDHAHAQPQVGVALACLDELVRSGDMLLKQPASFVLGLACACPQKALSCADGAEWLKSDRKIGKR